MAFNKETWVRGESLAAAFLKEQGFKILEVNFKNKTGEIDIITKDGNTFVFVEVKARSSLKFGRPSEAVTKTKQNKIRRVAEGYLIKQKNYPAAARFDVIEILDGKVEGHIKNAF